MPIPEGIGCSAPLMTILQVRMDVELGERIGRAAQGQLAGGLRGSGMVAP